MTERKVKCKLLEKEYVKHFWVLESARCTVEIVDKTLSKGSPSRFQVHVPVGSKLAMAQVGELFNLTFVKTENDTWVPKRI